MKKIDLSPWPRAKCLIFADRRALKLHLLDGKMSNTRIPHFTVLKLKMCKRCLHFKGMQVE